MANVYLADLRHNYAGVLSTDCMPLGIAYIKAVMDRDLPEAQSRMFAYPDQLFQAIVDHPPDVLMVGNYVWNEALGLYFARLLKSIRPDALTVMGGPNISVEPERQVAQFSQHPELDLYILGEADFLATEVVKHYLAAGMNPRKMGERHIPSCIYRQSDGQVVRTLAHDRTMGLEDIPSPWLTGIMDDFFDGKLAPMIETNRGCPFRCSFCVQGTSFYNKLTYFGMERLQAEIDTIGRLIKMRSPNMGTLRIADANYGMYERDVELSGWIAEAQKKYGWPTFIDATTGKNRPERIIESMEKVNGALMLYQAVQSLDEDVLRNIRRSNIKLQGYEQIQMYIRGRGLRSVSDLILGLPGESYKSHTEALFKMIDAGTNSMHCFQAMMLKGSDMEAASARDEFKFMTRFRVLPKNFGVYGGEKVFDIEEVIVGTDTLPFEDYIRCRKLHMTFSVFWNDNWFDDVVTFVKQNGIKASEWLVAMLEAMERDTGPVHRFLNEFVGETKGELFESRQACAEHYGREENFKRLQEGEIGDNLMYKYRAIASFHLWPEVCRLAMSATAKLLKSRGIVPDTKAFDAFWADLSRHQLLKHAHGENVDQILAPVSERFSHDIGAWIADGQPLTIEDYRLDEPEDFEFRLSRDGHHELEAALRTWSAKTKGLTKMVTRIRVSSQVRSCRPLRESATAK